MLRGQVAITALRQQAQVCGEGWCDGVHRDVSLADASPCSLSRSNRLGPLSTSQLYFTAEYYRHPEASSWAVAVGALAAAAGAASSQKAAEHLATGCAAAMAVYAAVSL